MHNLILIQLNVSSTGNLDIYFSYIFKGLHDVDKKWVKTVKENGKKSNVKGKYSNLNLNYISSDIN